jgi:pimeloyl-ACP methyl ester carboxylesterase
LTAPENIPRWHLTITPSIQAEFIQAGVSGPHVVLIHSSVSGARQWRRLMDDLKNRFQVRAVNLFGYGKSPPWTGSGTQSLEDQARLVETVLPSDGNGIYLVGHSFGGAVAMKLAARQNGRIAKLALLEANPFHLLAQAGKMDGFAEGIKLRDIIKESGACGEWVVAAERFADYWGGENTWRDMPQDRRVTFTEAIKPNFHEWDAVLNETTPLEEWATVLPTSTLAVCDPGTVLPIRQIDDLLRATCPGWTYVASSGGHMAPLSHPDVINPIVTDFLRR